jgi:hypothetical protein
MKNKIIFLFAFILAAFALSISAQQKAETFSEENLRNTTKTAQQKLKGAVYREKTRSESYKNGDSAPSYVENTVTEIVPPDRRHYFEEKIYGEETKTFESITIGEDFYFRFNDGEWKTGGFGRGSGSGQGSGVGSGEKRITIENKTERIFTRNAALGGQTANLFETIKTHSYSYRSNIYSIITKSAYWFDSKGRFIKWSDEYENTELKIISRSIREYEYDPTIKIEAPITKSN